MPNQFETHTSDAGTTIHLKMNGELIKNLIALDCIAITLFDIVFVYGFSLYTTNFIGPLSYQAFSFLKLLALS